MMNIYHNTLLLPIFPLKVDQFKNEITNEFYVVRLVDSLSTF